MEERSPADASFEPSVRVPQSQPAALTLFLKSILPILGVRFSLHPSPTIVIIIKSPI
jgi:hypothetical protein